LIAAPSAEWRPKASSLEHKELNIMNRYTTLGLTLATGLALGACQHDSNRMSSNNTYSENDRARMNDNRNRYDNTYDNRNTADNATHSDNRSNYDDRSTAANRNYDDRNASDNRTNYDNRNTADNRTNYNNQDASRQTPNDPNRPLDNDPNYAKSSTGYDPDYINRPRDANTDGSVNRSADNRNLQGANNRDIHGTDNRNLQNTNNRDMYGTDTRHTQDTSDRDLYGKNNRDVYGTNERRLDHSADRKWREDRRYLTSNELGWRSAARNSTDVVTLDQRSMYWYDDRNTHTSLRGDSWHDQQVVSMNESELPTAVKSGLTREADGATLSNTGRTTWNGQQAYTARMTKQGRTYQVITDANGDVLAMRRLD